MIGGRLLGQVLQVQVQAGRDLQAFAEQRFRTELLLDHLAHIADEVGRLLRTDLAGGNQREGRGPGAVVLLGGDGAGPHHLVEHVGLAVLRRRHVGVRVVVGGCLRQPRQQ